MPDGILAPVHGFVGAMNQRQIDDAAELFTEDAEFDGGPRFSTVFVGRPSIRGVLERYLEAIPEMNLIVRDIFVNANEVAVPIEIYATMGSNPDPERLPDWKAGRKLSWRGVFLFKISPEQKIQFLRIYGDDGNARWLPGVDANV